MKTSPNGIKLIEESEGLRLHVYEDGVGRPTIGYGHLIKEGEDFSAGITQAVAENLLIQDVAVAEGGVDKYASTSNQNQGDALVDFAFNLGVGSLAMMLAHGFDQVPQQILRWNKAGGQVEPGLSIRRRAELTLFNTPVTT